MCVSILLVKQAGGGGEGGGLDVPSFGNSEFKA
jgi:hypothetical protein